MPDALLIRAQRLAAEGATPEIREQAAEILRRREIVAGGQAMYEARREYAARTAAGLPGGIADLGARVDLARQRQGIPTVDQALQQDLSRQAPDVPWVPEFAEPAYAAAASLPVGAYRGSRRVTDAIGLTPVQMAEDRQALNVGVRQLSNVAARNPVTALAGEALPYVAAAAGGPVVGPALLGGAVGLDALGEGVDEFGMPIEQAALRGVAHGTLAGAGMRFAPLEALAGPAALTAGRAQAALRGATMGAADAVPQAIVMDYGAAGADALQGELTGNTALADAGIERMQQIPENLPALALGNAFLNAPGHALAQRARQNRIVADAVQRRALAEQADAIRMVQNERSLQGLGANLDRDAAILAELDAQAAPAEQRRIGRRLELADRRLRQPAPMDEAQALAAEQADAEARAGQEGVLPALAESRRAQARETQAASINARTDEALAATRAEAERALAERQRTVEGRRREQTEARIAGPEPIAGQAPGPASPLELQPEGLQRKAAAGRLERAQGALAELEAERAELEADPVDARAREELEAAEAEAMDAGRRQDAPRFQAAQRVIARWRPIVDAADQSMARVRAKIAAVQRTIDAERQRAAAPALRAPEPALGAPAEVIPPPMGDLPPVEATAPAPPAASQRIDPDVGQPVPVSLQRRLTQLGVSARAMRGMDLAQAKAEARRRTQRAPKPAPAPAAVAELEPATTAVAEPEVAVSAPQGGEPTTQPGGVQVPAPQRIGARASSGPLQRRMPIRPEAAALAPRIGGGRVPAQPDPAFASEDAVAARGVPGYQGGKSAMVPTTRTAVRSAMPESDRARVQTVVGMFGGSGGYELAHMDLFPQARRLYLIEGAPAARNRIRYSLERGNRLEEDWNSLPASVRQVLADAVQDAADTAKASGSLIARRVRDVVRQHADELTDDQAAVLEALAAHEQNSFGAKAKGEGATRGVDLGRLLRIVEKQHTALHAAAQRFRDRGGRIEVQHADAYAVELPGTPGSTFFTIDGPYYNQKGYQWTDAATGERRGEAITGAGTYEKTAGLTERIADRGDALMLTDSNWMRADRGNPPAEPARGAAALRRILDAAPHAQVTGVMGKNGRDELISLRTFSDPPRAHLTPETTNAASSTASVAPTRSADAAAATSGARARDVAGSDPAGAGAPTPAPRAAEPAATTAPHPPSRVRAVVERIRSKLTAAFTGFAPARLELDSEEPALVFRNGERVPLVVVDGDVDPDAWLNSMLAHIPPGRFADVLDRAKVAVPREWRWNAKKGEAPPTIQQLRDGLARMSKPERQRLFERTMPGLEIRFSDGSTGSPVAFLGLRELMLGRDSRRAMSDVGAEEALHVLWRAALSPGEQAAVLRYAAAHPTYAARARAATTPGAKLELGTRVLLDLAAQERTRGVDRAQLSKLRGSVQRAMDSVAKVAGDLWRRMLTAMGVKPTPEAAHRALSPDVQRVLAEYRSGELGARPFRRDGEADDGTAYATERPADDSATTAKRPIEPGSEAPEAPGAAARGEQALATRTPEPDGDDADAPSAGTWLRRGISRVRKALGQDAPVKLDQAEQRAEALLDEEGGVERIVRAWERGNQPKDGPEMVAQVLAMQAASRRLLEQGIVETDVEAADLGYRIARAESRAATAAGRILRALQRGDIRDDIDVGALFKRTLDGVGSVRWTRALDRAPTEEARKRVLKRWMAAKREVVDRIKAKSGLDISDPALWRRIAEGRDFYAVNVLTDAIDAEMPRERGEALQDWRTRATVGGLSAEVIRGVILNFTSWAPTGFTAGTFAAEAGLRPVAAAVLRRFRRDLPDEVTDAFGGTDAALKSVLQNTLTAASIAAQSSIRGAPVGDRVLGGRFARGEFGGVEDAAGEGGRALLPVGLRHAVAPGTELVRLADEFVWAQTFLAKQAFLAARRAKQGDTRPRAEIANDPDILDAARTEADTWTLRGDYGTSDLGQFFEMLSRGRSPVKIDADGTPRTRWWGLAGFTFFPIFKSYLKAMQKGLSLANVPGNAATTLKALRRASPEAAREAGVDVATLDAQQFKAGVEAAGRLIVGSVLLGTGYLLAEAASTTEAGTAAEGGERQVRETAEPAGTLADVPTTRLSPWHEPSQIGAIMKDALSKPSHMAMGEAGVIALYETLINRPLLSGLPVPRRDPETGEQSGFMESALRRHADLFAVGRPYADVIRRATETTAKAVPSGWLERNYGVSREDRPSWLGEKRPTGDFWRKLVFGGASVPTPREQEIAEHIMRVNTALARAGKPQATPYWFPPPERVFDGARGHRYTDAEYRALQGLAGSIFQSMWNDLPARDNPEARMKTLRWAWLSARAQARAIMEPKAYRRINEGR
jgi:hypothetical protein